MAAETPETVERLYAELSENEPMTATELIRIEKEYYAQKKREREAFIGPPEPGFLGPLINRAWEILRDNGYLK